jgi:DNA-binding Xre family transcriptional regulator
MGIKKLTSEGLAEKLPLLALKPLADESGVDHARLKNLKHGRIKELTPDELSEVSNALRKRNLSA